jgi:hypothetical protein
MIKYFKQPIPLEVNCIMKYPNSDGFVRFIAFNHTALIRRLQNEDSDFFRGNDSPDHRGIVLGVVTHNRKK